MFKVRVKVQEMHFACDCKSTLTLESNFSLCIFDFHGKILITKFKLLLPPPALAVHLERAY